MKTLLKKFNQDKRFWSLVILIILVAVALRFYKLGQVPHGMTWDEAAIGYNGYAVWTTRRDEWLYKLPISFMSFGDYKAPFAIYVNGFFTAIFGLNLFAVRLPFALAGIATVIGMGAVTWQLSGLLIKEKNKHSPAWNSRSRLTLVTMGLIALSPWHLHYSRAGFESGMALGIFIWGVFCLLRFVENIRNRGSVQKKSRLTNILSINTGWLISATIMFVLSMYTYHSAKIFVPSMGLFLLWKFRRVWLIAKKQVLLAGLIGVVLLSPMLWDSVRGSGVARLSQTSIFSLGQSWSAVVSKFSLNYIAHFSPNFLVLGQTPTLRHGNGVWGVLLPTTFILSIVALGFLFRKKHHPQQLQYGRQELAWFAIIWILLGYIPPALGVDGIPHSNRALFALPGFMLLGSIGYEEVVRWVKKTKLNNREVGNHGQKNSVRDAFIGIVFILHSFFFLSSIHYYFNGFAAASSEEFLDGYLDVFEIVKNYEKGQNGFPEVEKIIFTAEYGQPYIYAIFSRKTKPLYYRGGSLIKYEFKDVEIGDLLRKNTLVIGGKGDLDLPTNQADHLIYGSNNDLRFQVFYTEN